jgi:hypothetical protein
VCLFAARAQGTSPNDNRRHVGGARLTQPPGAPDELDALVWEQVRCLLEDPTLVRPEIVAWSRPAASSANRTRKTSAGSQRWLLAVARTSGAAWRT